MIRENLKLESQLCSKITDMEMTGFGPKARVLGRNAAVRQLLSNDRHERAIAKIRQNNGQIWAIGAIIVSLTSRLYGKQTA